MKLAIRLFSDEPIRAPIFSRHRSWNNMKTSLRPCGVFHRPSAPCPECAKLPKDRRLNDRRQNDDRRQQGRKPERAK